jgi:ABC-type sugar transport system permease subunit
MSKQPIPSATQLYTSPVSTPALILRLVLLAIFDAFAILMVIQLGRSVSWILGGGILIFAVVTNIVFLNEKLKPWRWVIPALAGMFLLIVYPMGYTLNVAFTNYGDNHILTKEQVIGQLQAQRFRPEDAQTYQTYVYVRNSILQGIQSGDVIINNESISENDLAFWLTLGDGSGFAVLPEEADAISVPVDGTNAVVGARNEDGIPQSLGDYSIVERRLLAQFSFILNSFNISKPAVQVQLDRLRIAGYYEAANLVPVFAYDPVTNTVTNQQTGKVYIERTGTFVPEDGEGQPLRPGFATFIGAENILRVINDPNIRDPFVRVFVWTVVFALGSVLSTFAVGLMFALVLNVKELPLRPLWRSLLIIPYAVPFWLSAATWRGLVNPELGPVNQAIKALIGVSPNWFADPTLAKIIVLFVNLYLGFPYMMLVCLGALQSIPGDMYEAATIDGADDRQQFQFITLPMLLVAIGPLLIASFAFNFNNFTLVELLTRGDPPMQGVAGHTDILLSYTFQLAFGGVGGTDYGFAAAISIFIFFIVGTITLINFRFTRQLEQVSENV